MEEINKQYNTVGCCGADCGLCIRYQQKDNGCPGCGGDNFYEHHAECGCLTCCVDKRGIETCVRCFDYPCEMLKQLYDANTIPDKIAAGHAKSNLEFIQKHFIERFLERQGKRKMLLEVILKNYNDGSLLRQCCQAAMLLPIADLQSVIIETEKRLAKHDMPADNPVVRAEIFCEVLKGIAEKDNIDL